MAPIAAGFMFMVFRAAFTGVLAGAVAGAVAWRLRIGPLRGMALAVLAYLVLFATTRWHMGWMRLWVTWGLPATLLTFLIGSLAARGLGAGTRLRPIWTTLIAFLSAVVAGFVYLFSFRISLWTPVPIALVADACLVLVLALLHRRAVTPPG